MLKTEQIKNELVRYIAANPKMFQAALLSDSVQLNKYTRLVTKVKGHYPAVNALMTHVVQSFYSKKFTPFGDIHFLKKDLKNFHQKVDFELDPAEILGTLFEEMYDEDKKPDQKSISKTSIQMLKDKIIDDVNILSIEGEYDPASVGSDTPVFGTSMDGLNKVIQDNLNDTDNPVFLIPGDAITSANAVDSLTDFERGLPQHVKRKVKRIFTSDVDLENYILEYEDRFGQNQFQKNTMKTRLGKREIVGLPGLTPGTVFATTNDNFLRLVDIIENPAQLTDVQVHDRILRVYGEFTLGYDFAVNQGVYIHTADGTKNRGLNNAEQNKLFYPSEDLI